MRHRQGWIKVKTKRANSDRTYWLNPNAHQHWTQRFEFVRGEWSQTTITLPNGAIRKCIKHDGKQGQMLSYLYEDNTFYQEVLIRGRWFVLGANGIACNFVTAIEAEFINGTWQLVQNRDGYFMNWLPNGSIEFQINEASL